MSARRGIFVHQMARGLQGVAPWLRNQRSSGISRVNEIHQRCLTSPNAAGRTDSTIVLTLLAKFRGSFSSWFPPPKLAPGTASDALGNGLYLLSKGVVSADVDHGGAGYRCLDCCL